MTTALLKTQLQEEREARDRAIYQDWCAMTSVEGQSKTRVTEFLMQKYGIHSQGTIWAIRRRVEETLKTQQEG